jgi:hypothetical protein
MECTPLHIYFSPHLCVPALNNSTLLHELYLSLAPTVSAPEKEPLVICI